MAAGPPLDYSFKEIRTCVEIETEEPRSGEKRTLDQKDSDDAAKAANTQAAAAEQSGATATSGAAGASGVNAAAKAGAVARKLVIKKVTTCVKLNNNMLESVNGLPQALETAMPAPLHNLQWLDMSFNQLTTVEPELLKFTNLKALYLHGNVIRKLPAVERLRKLPKLLSLTLNGNPIESKKIYRCFVIGALTQLRSLDHSTITEEESLGAGAWFKGHLRRVQKRREEQEEKAALAAAME